MVVAGIGGTGVVTVTAILAMAARIEGFGASVFDMTGLSQKGGAVLSHLQLSRDRGAVMPAKVGPGRAALVLACDMVAATAADCLETISAGACVVANTDVVATAAFQQNPDQVVDAAALLAKLADAAGGPPLRLPASTLAEGLLGDSIGANMLMLGYAWQMGALPLGLEAIEQAIRLNGKAVAPNLKAFAAGRRAALEPATPNAPPTPLADFVADRTADLTAYWRASYARRYSALIERARIATANLPGGDRLVWALARSAYRLMAYKDEYEVARLYTDGRFRAELAHAFEDLRAIRIHLAPPLLARRDAATGRPRKMAFGAWILPLLSLLAALKGLREGPLDVFGRTTERRLERALRDAYLSRMERELSDVSPATLEATIQLAQSPLDVRGFGQVKAPAAQALLARLRI